MIRVISSPSSSTTGFLTLIFPLPVAEAMLRLCAPPLILRFSAANLLDAEDAMRREGEYARVEDLLEVAPTSADRRGFIGGREPGSREEDIEFR